MDCLAGPSFHAGNGSAAWAMMVAKATAQNNEAILRLVFMAVFFVG
jgi:hypothetical protein